MKLRIIFFCICMCMANLPINAQFNTYKVTERGDGQLNVFGQDLSSGLYTYSLVADGQLIATKKMVKN